MNAGAGGRGLWNNRAFVIFWIGQGLSNVGDAFAMIALPIVALEATGSVAQMGLVTAASAVGRIATGLVAGYALDRFDRRRLMIALDAGRAAAFGLIPLVWWLAGPQPWVLYVSAITGAGLGAAFRVAYVTAVPSLVARQQLPEANGVLESTYALAYLVGPLLAGVVATQWGAAVALGVDATTFMVSALSLAATRFQAQAPAAPGRATSRLNEALEGVRFLWEQPVLRSVTFLLAGLQWLVAGAYDLFIYHMRHDMGQGSDAVGVVFGVASIGGVAAGLLAGRLRRSFGAGPCFVASLALQGIALIGIGLVTFPPLFVALIVAAAFSDTLKGVLSQSLRQQAAPDHLLGRVASAYWLVTSIAASLGAAAVTAVAASLGAAWTLSLVGIAVSGLAVLALLTPARGAWPVAPAAPAPIPVLEDNDAT
jgi:MFS family permease